MTTWRERIVAAQERGFTWEDRRDARRWATCAVGEQHALHPEVVVYLPPDGVFTSPYPADPVLLLLGDNHEGFCAAVDDQDVDRAAKLLEQIEDRVLELKRAVGR